MYICRRPDSQTCLFLFIWRCRVFQVFFVSLPFSLGMESTSYVFPSGCFLSISLIVFFPADTYYYQTDPFSDDGGNIMCSDMFQTKTLQTSPDHKIIPYINTKDLVQYHFFFSGKKSISV